MKQLRDVGWNQKFLDYEIETLLNMPQCIIEYAQLES